jgi:hypothetical protein
MDLLNFKNSSEGLGGEDVDLNLPHMAPWIFSTSKTLQILHTSFQSCNTSDLLVSQFLQHLPEHIGDLASITSVVLELANISIWKWNP